MAGNPYAQLDQFAGSAYGVNPQVLSAIGMRESGNRANASNNWDSNARAGTPSKGRMQFIAPTYSAYARQAKAANPAAWKGVADSWLNPEAQTLAAAWAIKNGHGSAWSTYRAALRDAGGKVGGSVATVPRQQFQQITGQAPTAPAQDSSKLASLSLLFDDDPDFAGFIRQRAEAETQPAAPMRTQQPLTTPSIGTAASGVGSGVSAIEAFGKRFGLVPGSTTGGKHASGSYHYQGKAVDFGDATNQRAKLAATMNYLRAHPKGVLEAFYDPSGFYIKNGVVHQGAFGGHSDHLHIAE